jgi:magnesium-transporting ATPase (P-type)
MATEYDSSQCFVLTSSLDGEKNLKPKLALKTVQDNLNSLMKENENSKFEVQLPNPDRNLYYFSGAVQYAHGTDQNR